MQKLSLYLCVMTFFCLAVAPFPVIAADQDWTNGSGDRDWSNHANWNNNVVPRSTDKAAIRNSSVDGPIIDSTTNAEAKTVVIGDWTSTADTLDMTGGSLTANEWLILGYGSNNKGTFSMTYGAVSVGSNMYIGFDGSGTLNISGGSLTVTNQFGIAKNAGSAGKVLLDGGIINSGSFLMTSGGLLDMTSGKLIINGDAKSVIDTYSNNGWITAFSGSGTLKVDYDMLNPGKTTVTADPPVLMGDATGDGSINLDDFRLMVSQWLAANPDSHVDFTYDQKVNMEDFNILSSNWKINEYSRTLTGKIMCGYQGWFNCTGDGADRGWVHWGSNNKFQPGHCTVDWWPEMSEYDEDEKFATPFRYPDGSTAHVFSSYNEKTVLRHFSWMQQHGIDGVFLQRFATETNPGSRGRNHRDKVMLNCQKGANQYKRAWAMMYDISGLPAGGTQKVINDWKYLVDTFQLTKDPEDYAYLHHNGKPVVSIWGIGFQNRQYTLDECKTMVEFFKNDPDYGGVTLMLGVPSYWRTLSGDSVSDPKLHDIIKLADVISPWAVGRYGSKNESELNNYTNNVTTPDKIWCDSNNKEYLPVVFPGFSWQNLKGEKWDHIPRLGGAFLWRQYFKAINDAGATMIYQAMFDEVDEGTAIFKCTSSPPIAESPDQISTPFLPTGNADFVPYDSTDADLPSDHYLWLVGQASKMLTGEIAPTETMPTRK